MKLLARWSAAATAVAAGTVAAAAVARPTVPRPTVSPQPVAGAMALLADEEDVPPRGCGWFESSHELGLGLQVTEHVDLDRTAGSLPLDIWLAWQLAGFRANASASVGSAPAAGARLRG